MNRHRSKQAAVKRHQERLSALEGDMRAGQYFTALESTKRILGDKTIPPDMRLAVTLQEVRALLGSGQPQQAAVRACAAVNTMNQYGLWNHAGAVEAVLILVECARGVRDVGNVGY